MGKKPKKNMRIGILTWHYYDNFGSLLQTFALQTVLEILGYKPIILNYRSKRFAAGRSYWKMPVRYLLGKLYEIKIFRRFLKNSYSSVLFQKKYFRQSKLVNNERGLTFLTSNFDCLISGSDQIWAPNVFNPIYMLSFAKKQQIKKISYASSIGLNYIPDNLVPIYKELLSRYDAVSVREETGKQLIYNKCGIDAKVVLDPTLLIERKKYVNLEKIPILEIKAPYIFCYFLKENHSYQQVVVEYAKRNNYHVLGVSKQRHDSSWLQNLTMIGPREFLWLVDHAMTVFTDSYHGTIFSLLFHKNFFVFKRFEENDAMNQNSRIFQLDNWFRIGVRLISEDNNLEEVAPYNFDYFEERLKYAREKSIDYLSEALK